MNKELVQEPKPKVNKKEERLVKKEKIASVKGKKQEKKIVKLLKKEQRSKVKLEQKNQSKTVGAKIYDKAVNWISSFT